MTALAGSSPLTRGKQWRVDASRARARLIPAHAGKTRSRPGLGLSCRAHPRSRGENMFSAPRVQASRGSSPLTRGKPAAPGKIAVIRRLIPAHAGKTRSRRDRATACPAHPRSRGENCAICLVWAADSGSSPLTRGKRCRRLLVGRLRRLIPAHAGKTSRGLSTVRAATAHPRSRGENVGTGSGGTGTRGSSPLTRGKRQRGHDHDYEDGLIPAHAGKTSGRR